MKSILSAFSFSVSGMLQSTRDLFAIGLRRQNGDLLRLNQCQFTGKASGKGLWSFGGCDACPALSVQLHFRVKNGALYESFSVQGIPADLAMEWIEPLRLTVADPHGQLFMTRHEGQVIDKPLENVVYHEPGWHAYEFYPGWNQMQFMAYFSGSQGLCLMAQDSQCGTKFLNAKIEDEQILLLMRIYCGGAFGAPYESGYEVALLPCAPNWMGACQCYREWLEASGFSAPKGQYPEMVTESPVVVIYPVRGDGDDRGAMKPNEYYPYAKALPVIDRLAKQFDAKILALLMHWEGTAPWAPPYVWPPLGGEKLLAKYRDGLHAKGNYLGVYCSGTAWTTQSRVDLDYRTDRQFQKEHLEKQMIHGPHGELEAAICCGPEAQRLGYDMCNSQPWSQKTVDNEVGKLADFGIDYAQYFDQNIGGAAHLCWARNHKHPPVPGPWQTANQIRLLQKLRKDHPQILLGSESGAAEPYLQYLPFSDMRFECWDAERARPVPAYAFVFHEYVNNFMGNQCCVDFCINYARQPENLLWRAAYAFASGNLLSVVLKEHGNIHWGWIEKWDRPAPDQKSIITLIRNLNAVRKRYPQFLIRGRMLMPLAKVTGPAWELPIPGRWPRVLDSYFATSWQAPDGSRALILTNFRPVAQTVKVDGKPVKLPALSATVLPM